MKLSSAIIAAVVAFSLAAASACSDDEKVGQVWVAADEASEAEGAYPAADTPTEFGTLEQREATLVVVKSVRVGDDQYSAEILNVIEDNMFIDLDEEEGPEQWITNAEVHNESGDVIWRGRTNSLFQLLEFLKVIIAETAALPFSVDQIYRYVDMEYPELLEFAIRFPKDLEGATDYVVTVPDKDGERYEVARWSIKNDIKPKVGEPRLKGEVTTIVDNGPPQDRIDVVILADGYREAERDKFDADAALVAERLLTASPISEHRDMFNVHTVWTPSVQSGAGYDCINNNCTQEFRDTVFNTVFVLTAISAQLQLDLGDTSDRMAMPINIGMAFDAAANAPYDEIVMLSNSRRRSGFAGLYVALVTAFDDDQFAHVGVHEFGHTFGILGDEYQADGDACYYAEPRITLPANIGQNADGSIKWSQWVAEDAPLPTPDFAFQEYAVGAYEGAYNCDYLYRPSFNCKMQSSSDEFCPVCSEQVSKRTYGYVDTLKNEPVRVERAGAGAVRVTLPLWEPARYRVEWTLDGTVVGEGPVLELAPSDAPSDWADLEASVQEASGFIRSDDDFLRAKRSLRVKRSE